MHRKRLIWRLYLPVLCLTLLPLVGMGLYATYTTSRLFEARYLDLLLEIGTDVIDLTGDHFN
ncbi:MAG TPA: hypothetical protein DEW46_09330, partial [Verrucomicrobia bacterium]|nr:hypothetical protein [Verrucomicrobiota bacterium]